MRPPQRAKSARRGPRRLGPSEKRAFRPLPRDTRALGAPIPNAGTLGSRRAFRSRVREEASDEFPPEASRSAMPARVAPRERRKAQLIIGNLASLIRPDRSQQIGECVVLVIQHSPEIEDELIRFDACNHWRV